MIVKKNLIEYFRTAEGKRNVSRTQGNIRLEYVVSKMYGARDFL